MASPSPSQTTRRSVRLSGDKATPSDSSTLPLAHFVMGVVDRSGSMASMGSAPPEQMRSQMLELKIEAEKAGVSTYMSVVTFDDRVETFMDNIKLDGNDDLPSYEDFNNALSPRGTTRFYDTVYECLDTLESRRDDYLASLPHAVKILSPKVVCSILVLTDGADNASTSHNCSTIAARMTEARANGVNAIFLAANIDAGAVGCALGFAKQATVQMNASYHGASQCMRAVSAGLRQASSGANDVNYSQLASQNCTTSSGTYSTVAPTMPGLRGIPMPPPPPLRRY